MKLNRNSIFFQNLIPGLVIFLVGLISSYFVFTLVDKGIIDSIKTRFWEKTPCIIKKSDVVLGDYKKYYIDILYSYEKNGKIYTSDKYSFNNISSYTQDSLLIITQELFAKPDPVCYINPSNHGEAVLAHFNNYLSLILFIVPLLVLRWGAKIIYKTFVPQEEEEEETKKTIKIWVTILIITVCILPGLVAAGCIWPKIFIAFTSIGWTKTPCIIISSESKNYKSGKESFSHLNILYQYQYDGKLYKSNKFTYFELSSGDHMSKYNIARQYTEKENTFCFVNPGKPYEAVLNNKPNWEMLFVLFPLPFLLFGIGGIFVLKKLWKNEPYKTGILNDC